LGGDRGSPFGRIQLSKLAIEGGEDLVDDAADQPQRMAHRHPLFEVDIGKQFTRPYVRTAHRFLLLLLNSTGIRFALQCQSSDPVFSAACYNRTSRSRPFGNNVHRDFSSAGRWYLSATLYELTLLHNYLGSMRAPQCTSFHPPVYTVAP